MNYKEHPPNSIIWISGMPRSGTTWISQIFASSPNVRLKFCPLYSYTFKNLLNEKSTAHDWKKFFEDVYKTKSEYLDQDYLRNQGLVPESLEKTNSPEYLVIKSTRFHNLVPYILKLHANVVFVHIVRHPCASIYSWLNNPLEFPDNADPAREWKSGACRKNGHGEFWGFSDWKKTTEQALTLAKIYPRRFKIIRYEDIIKSPESNVQQMFDFCGINFQQQTKDFLTLSTSTHNENKRSVFKDLSQISKWQECLDSNIARYILDDIKNSELQQFVM